MINFSDLAALTIHDVKNRLAIIASRAEARGDSDTVSGVMQAAQALTNLLLFYRAERDQLRLNIDAYMPSDLLTEMALELAKPGKFKVSVDCQAAASLSFYDEALVRMVLMDAAYNASRHARAEIKLTARVEAGYLEFTVADDGPGYPPEILDPATPLPRSNNEGTGLGLFLARHIASLHQNNGLQGSLALRNDPGAVFCLRLPQ